MSCSKATPTQKVIWGFLADASTDLLTGKPEEDEGQWESVRGPPPGKSAFRCKTDIVRWEDAMFDLGFRRKCPDILAFDGEVLAIRWRNAPKNGASDVSSPFDQRLTPSTSST